jgi:iron complex transport system permease protein
VASERTREDEIAVGWKIAVFAGLAALVLLWTPFWGIDRVPFSALWGEADDPTAINILWELRIPRVLMAFLAGAALATGGMVLQAVFRSPLATPFTLGVSSGAALGASLVVQFGWTFAWQGVCGVSLAGVAGAAISLAIVYVISTRSRQGRSAPSLLLAGLAVCLCFSSLIVLLQYTRNANDFARLFQMVRWTLGGLDGVENIVQFRDVWSAAPFVAAGCLIVWYLLHELNLLAAGEEFAFSRGVDVNHIKLLLFFAVSLAIGGAVAVCGPIGLVGLLAPHLSRRIVGPDHRRLYPATWLLGGTLLTTCDAATRTLSAPTELPVGIVMAVLSAPLFLWLVLARRPDLGAE